METKLELKGITKHFKHSVLSDCHFVFRETGLYAIYGISGSGKSTLLNIIAGFETPDSGEILSNYNGLEYVMQDHMLLTNVTVKENLYIKLNVSDKPTSEYDAVIQKVCKQLRIEKLIDEKVSVLSGGEKQRVSLARALINTPDIILLDEPTSSIDHELKIELIQLLLELSKEHLIIVTTHDPLIKEHADTTLFLERGTVYEQEVSR